MRPSRSTGGAEDFLHSGPVVGLGVCNRQVKGRHRAVDSYFRMKVLVIGSGPIVIGQAAEFDYAGTQACKSLKEEGHEVVLINSNPATIMTDPGVADRLYIEPLNVDFCERVIARERPDALLPTLGGQTGLNLATQLNDAGILEKYHVKLLGTPLSAIRKAEDREQFRDLMREIREPVPESWIIQTPEELEAVLDVVPYPCIIRPAYTLGGTGGGIADDREALWEIGQKGLKLSMRSQIMVICLVPSSSTSSVPNTLAKIAMILGKWQPFAPIICGFPLRKKNKKKNTSHINIRLDSKMKNAFSTLQ